MSTSGATDGDSGSGDSTSYGFVTWPSIGLLHNVTRNLSSSKERRDLVVQYKSKIKLHGMNCGVTIHSDGRLQIQSRTVFIDNQKAGFAGWVNSNQSFFESLASSTLHHFGKITLFGEWAGPGIQKGTSVSIGKLKNCIWAVFGAISNGEMVVEPDELLSLIGPHAPPDLHVIPWMPQYLSNTLTLNYESADTLSPSVGVMDALVASIDREDPWVLSVFNISGPGEGVVWYPVSFESSGRIPVDLFELYSFKTKGEAHLTTKTSKPGIQITTLCASSPVDFVDMFVTRPRLLQGLTEACPELTLEAKPAFISWILRDVRKESTAELQDSHLAWDQVENLITQRAEEWFTAELANIKSAGPQVNKMLFSGMIFCFSESVPFKEKNNSTKNIKDGGGQISYSFSSKCTHLIACQQDIDRKSTKVTQALALIHSGQSLSIINPKYVEDSIALGTRAPESKYDLSAQTATRKHVVSEEDAPSIPSAIRAAIYRPTVWRYGEKNEPNFPATEYDIVKMDVLQAMEASGNTNKFYCMELHVSNEGFNSNKYMYRIFTQHGRTDELSTNKRGTCETRYFDNLSDAEILYEDILSQKLSDEKGYHKVELVSASSRIGSKPRAEADERAASTATSSLPTSVQQLIRRIFSEASDALSRTVSSRITTQGIETPLGVVSLDQVLRGEQVLSEVSQLIGEQPLNSRKIEALSSEFYSLIPHILGNKREDIARAVLNNQHIIDEKLELLQLMKDIIKVNSVKCRNSSTSEVDRMYSALGCTITPVAPNTPQFPANVASLFAGINICSAYSISRTGEERSRFKAFCSKRGIPPSAISSATASTPQPAGLRYLVHGTKPENTLGILSRGLLLPVMLTNSSGVKRTDFGYLGAGLYFGDTCAASAKYAIKKPSPSSSSSSTTKSTKPKSTTTKTKSTSPSTTTATTTTTPKSSSSSTTTATASSSSSTAVAQTWLMLVFRVYVGRPHDYTHVCPTLTSPPNGCDSCHGVAATATSPSDFVDNEWVVYDLAQQQLEYVVEFKL
ncbi:RNA ligase 2 [Pelomyxa schiedti]|nr:RNA ligase 2 [Pelomyxa schiedti]